MDKDVHHSAVYKGKKKKKIGHDLKSQQKENREFPGGSVVRIWHFHCPGFNAWSGN